MVVFARGCTAALRSARCSAHPGARICSDSVWRQTAVVDQGRKNQPLLKSNCWAGVWLRGRTLAKMFYSSSEAEFLCFTNQVSPKASSGCRCVSDTKPSLCSTCVLSMLYILTLFKCACGSSGTFSMQEVSESLQFLLLPLKQLTRSSSTSMSGRQHVGVEAHWLRCMHLQVISGIPLWGLYCPTPPPTPFLRTQSLCSYMLERLRTAFSGFVNWSSLSSRCVSSAVLELYGVIYSQIVYVNLDFFFFFPTAAWNDLVAPSVVLSPLLPFIYTEVI